jgi:hypothetical protein
MLKTAVGGPWIDIIGPSQLLDPPEALKLRAIHDPTFKVCKTDEAVNGATDFTYDGIVLQMSP